VSFEEWLGVTRRCLTRRHLTSRNSLDEVDDEAPMDLQRSTYQALRAANDLPEVEEKLASISEKVEEELAAAAAAGDEACGGDEASPHSTEWGGGVVVTPSGSVLV